MAIKIDFSRHLEFALTDTSVRVKTLTEDARTFQSFLYGSGCKEAHHFLLHCILGMEVNCCLKAALHTFDRQFFTIYKRSLWKLLQILHHYATLGKQQKR